MGVVCGCADRKSNYSVADVPVSNASSKGMSRPSLWNIPVKMLPDEQGLQKAYTFREITGKKAKAILLVNISQ